MWEQLVSFLAIFCVVYLLKRLHVVEKKDAKFLGKLLFNLVIPVVIISILSTMQFDRQLWVIPASSALVVAALVIISFTISKAAHMQNKIAGAFIILFSTFEGGMVGYGFALALYHEAGFARIVLFDLANMISCFTLMYFISCWYGKSDISIKNVLKRFATTPIVWSLPIGIALNLINFTNTTVSAVFSAITSGTLFLIIVLLALEFDPHLKTLKLPLLTCLKMLVGAAIGYGCTLLFGVTGLERTIIVLGAALPPSMMMLLYAQQNHLDEEYAASTLSIALPLGFVVLSILAILL